MLEDKNPSKTSLEQLGEFGLIDRLTKDFPLTQKAPKQVLGTMLPYWSLGPHKQ